MPYPRHQQVDMKGLEVVADSFLGSVTLSDLTTTANLTDSTAGTPSTTVVAAIPAATAATTDTSAASLTSVNASLAALRNDLSTLTGKVNAILTALKT